MNRGYWAADSIGQRLGQAIAAQNVIRGLRQQQGFHAGDLAVMRAALTVLGELQPDHPLLNNTVSARVLDLGRHEFYSCGWKIGSSLHVDLAAVVERLHTEFAAAQAVAIKMATAEPINERRRGWILINRRTVWVWRKREHPTKVAALAAKTEELQRLNTAQLGATL